MNTPEEDIAELASVLYQGALSHSVALEILRDPRSEELIREIELVHYPRVGLVSKKQGGPVQYSPEHYLKLATADASISNFMDRVWLAGALLTLGDALAKADYLDRSPVLELVRHLRNGIAHGNRFEIRNPDQLTTFPAHNRDSPIRAGDTKIFEITPGLNGTPVLYDFMAAGDVIEHLCAVHVYVASMVDGQRFTTR